MREPALDLEQARFLSPKYLVCRLPWVHLVDTTVAKIQVLLSVYRFNKTVEWLTQMVKGF